jgi:hypothetical protein
MSSQLGDHLLALGYTADEANQSMVTYLGAAGVSNAKDLQSNAALREGAAQYLEEIDRLAQVTGKSRQEQEETMKKQKLDAEVQMTASRIKNPADRAKFEANVKYMTDMYGDAGKDMAIAQAQHRSVVTKEGQTLAGLAPGMQSAMEKMAKAQLGSQEYIDAQNEMSLAAQKGLDRIPTAAFSTNDSLKKLSKAQLTVAQQEEAGLTSKKALSERDKKIADDKAARDTSQAADMAKAMAGFKELGAELWSVFSPLLSAVSFVAKLIGGLASGIATVIKGFNNVFDSMGTFGSILKGGLVVWLAWIAATRIATAQTLLKNGMTGALNLVRGGGGLIKDAAGSIASRAPGALGGVVSAGGGGAGGGIGGAVSGMLSGLAEGLKKLGDPKAMLGAVTVGLLAGTLWIASKGLENFANISWESMAKGFVTLLGLGALAAVLSFAAPFIIAGSVAIGIMGLALIPFGYAMSLVGKGMADFATNLNSLTGLDGGKLLALGEGIMSLSAALVAFAAASVVGGLASIGSKITNFFSGGGPIAQIKTAVSDLTPVLPQLVQIGPAINSYANGIVAFGKAVSGVDIAKAEKLKDILKGPGVLEGIGSAIKDVGAATAKLVSAHQGGQEKSGDDLAALNKTMQQILAYMKDTADNTKKNVAATKALNNNLFSA